MYTIIYMYIHTGLLSHEFGDIKTNNQCHDHLFVAFTLQSCRLSPRWTRWHGANANPLAVEEGAGAVLGHSP